MKKRLLSLFMALNLCAGLLPPLPAQAVGTAPAESAMENPLGSPITYKPVTQLYMKKTDKLPVKFFDADLTVWDAKAKELGKQNKTSGSDALAYLQPNHYLLNRYMIYDREWGGEQYPYNDITTGFFRPQIGHPNVIFRSDGLNLDDHEYMDEFGRYQPDTSNVGNVLGMMEKGDLQYKFTCTLHNEDWYYNQGAHRWHAADIIELITPFESHEQSVHNCTVSGIHASKSGFPTIIEDPKHDSWVPSGRFKQITIKHSLKKPNSGINNCMVVGRDVRGPKMKEVWVSSDPQGKNPITDTLNLKIINEQLQDRKIYFHIRFDEPVIYRNEGQLSNLALKIPSLGQDKSSGPESEAYFLSFAPDQYDPAPVMTFEYKIPDPYNIPKDMDPDKASALEERGKKYKFEPICINSSLNADLFYNIQDLSGNLYGKEKGIPEGERKGSECTPNGQPAVDILPYAVDEINVYTDPKPKAGTGGYVALGGTLGIRLQLSEQISSLQMRDGVYDFCPVVTLNLLDEHDRPVTLGDKGTGSIPRMVKTGRGWEATYSPIMGNWDNQSSQAEYILRHMDVPGRIKLSDEKEYYGANDSQFWYPVTNDFIEYNMQLVPGKVHLPPGETRIRVTAITAAPGGRLLNNSGNALMDYKLTTDGTNILEPVALSEGLVVHDDAKRSQIIFNHRRGVDKAYVMDFDPPQMQVELRPTEDPTILELEATLSDDHVPNSTINYRFSFDRCSPNGVDYQASTSQGYEGSLWKHSSSSYPSFTSPIGPVEGTNQGKSFAYLKFPDNANVYKVTVTAEASDEPGNIASDTFTLSMGDTGWEGIDTTAPVVLLKSHPNDSEQPVLELHDYFLNGSASDTSLEYRYAWGEQGGSAPAEHAWSGWLSYQEAALCEIPIPQDMPPSSSGTMVYNRVLYVQGRDARGNVSSVRAAGYSFDRSSSVINLAKVGNDGLHAELTVEHADKASLYWHVWLEKPSNFIVDNGDGTTTDYGGIVPYLYAMKDTYIPDRTSPDYTQSAKGPFEDFAYSMFSEGFRDDETGTDVGPSNDLKSSRVGFDEIDDYLPKATSPNMPDADRVGNTVTVRFNIAPGDPVKNPTSERGIDLIAIPYDRDRAENPEFGDMGNLKWGTDRKDSSLYGTKTVRECVRPLILLVGVVLDDGTTQVHALEFDPPAIPNRESDILVSAQQVRLSTNDRNGNRLDHQMPYPDDPYNDEYLFSEVYDFVEAEFYISATNLYPMDKYNLNRSRIQLIRTETNSRTSPYDPGIHTVVQEWPLAQLPSSPVSDGSYQDYQARKGWLNGMPLSHYESPCGPITSYVVSFDPSILQQGLVTISEPDQEGESHMKNVTYRFRLVLSHDDWEYDYPPDPSEPPRPDIPEYHEDFRQWLVDNSAPRGALRRPGQEELAQAPVELIGLGGSDVTTSVPVCTLPGRSSQLEFMLDQAQEIIEERYPGEPGQPDEVHRRVIARQYTMASRSHISSPGEPGCGFGPAVRVGLSPSDMPVTGEFAFGGSSHDYVAVPPITVDISSLMTGQTTTRIYYQFFDKYRGCSSPIYVADIRQDATPPTAELYVSEMTAPSRQVTIHVGQPYDGHMEDGRFVVDTPVWSITSSVSAKQWVTDAQGGRTLQELKPDENGVYHFTGNGYLERIAVDSAGNTADTLLVNGKPYTAESPEPEYGAGAGPRYYVTNVDAVPPEFVEAPSWTADASHGSVAVSAVVKDAVSAYILFDEAYMTALTPGDPGQAGVNREPISLRGGSAGIWDYSLNEETGKLSFTLFVKPDTTLTTAKLILEDRAGNRTESPVHTFGKLTGVKPFITNSAQTGSGNSQKLPVYKSTGSLSFSAPVSLSSYQREAALAHSRLPIYSDGAMNVTYEDMFGGSYEAPFYADIFGPAYAHRLVLRTPDGSVISPNTLTNQDLTVEIDVSGNPELKVEGQSVFTLTQNGTVTYTLVHKTLGSMTASLPIQNIDKTPPVANISTEYLAADVGGEHRIYGVTYQIVDYSGEKGVSLTEKNALSRVTIDSNSPSKTHTFTYRDPAGNVGSTTVDASAIQFSNMADSKLVSTRVTWRTANGRLLDPSAILTNDDVMATVEGLNSKGQVVPTRISASGTVPDAVQVLSSQSSVFFSGESGADRSVSLTVTDNFTHTTQTASVTLPGGSVDKTPPTGRVEFEVQDNNSVYVYLQVTCDDLAPGGISIDGQSKDGKPLELNTAPDGRLYVPFDRNGTVRFILTDKAGNVGTVAAAVDDIDKDPAQANRENWQSGSSYADTSELIDKLLSTYTNNSIFVFLSFNEQLARSSVRAFANRTDEPLKELTPTSDYVSASISGNLLTLEFKQNCQAQVKVYDHWNNETVLWRPEDAPISVIDRDIPTFTEGAGSYDSAKNVWRIPYTFNEPVLLNKQAFLGTGDGPQLSADDPYAQYKTEWTVELDRNGKHSLTFLDRAGNVVTATPTVTQVDENAPELWVGTDVAAGSAMAMTDDGSRYTNGTVMVCLKAQDSTPDGVTFSARELQLSGQPAGDIPIRPDPHTMTVQVLDPADPGSTKTETVSYTHAFEVDENGTYEITASDKWGHKTTLRADVTIVDRLAPSLVFTSSKTPKVSRNAAADAVKAAALQGVKAEDQNGLKVTLNADISAVDTSAPGNYTVTITASDALGNSTSRTRTLAVLSGENREFTITPPGGTPQIALNNDIFTVTAGQVSVNINPDSFKHEAVHLSWAKGYLTAAQMKHAAPLALGGSFSVEDGYYTVLAQCADRSTYLVYLYVIK